MSDRIASAILSFSLVTILYRCHPLRVKVFHSFILLISLIVLISCSTTSTSEFLPTVSPEPIVSPQETIPAKVDPETLQLELLSSYPAEQQPRDVVLRLFPQDATVSVFSGSELTVLESASREKDRSTYNTDASAVLLEADGYIPVVLSLNIDGKLISGKLERSWKEISKNGETATEWQPKSVRFAPDGRSVFVANLGVGTAMSQFSVETPELIRHFQVPEKYQDAAGFVETVILPGRNEIWLSQMTLNTIHIFDMDSAEHLAAIKISGVWPKVLLASEDESKVYVSCWESDSVVEIDVVSRKEIRSLATGSIPRGLALSPDGSEMLVALFNSSAVDRINLNTGLRTALYDAAPGHSYAMRHIVHDEERGEYYITAMGVGRVYRLSESGKWLGYWTVGDKPNTCAISPDGHRLFVSCRGPNNPDTGYLTRGYEFGKVFVIDLDTASVEGWFWGQDQTTGLDISPNGSLLAFSNFLTPSLEIYELR